MTLLLKQLIYMIGSGPFFWDDELFKTGCEGIRRPNVHILDKNKYIKKLKRY